MSKLDEVSAWISERLPRLIAEHQVPAAAVAVAMGDELVVHSLGVLNKATGVEATVDSVHQIGSITKLWTATMVMQLVDEGLVDLDAPVRTYLPEFTIADESAAAVITVRQLLSHTAGFEGDLFNDTGQGEDAVEKYLPTLADVPQLFPPGTMFSYNNAGFSVLGRIVEVLRGKTYSHCLQEYLVEPLGLTHVAPTAWEAIRFRAATGHISPEPDGEPQAAPVWALTRSNEPAGSMLAMRPRDLIAFARMHLNRGVAADGTRVLSEASTAAMLERQVDVPGAGVLAESWGLGFELFRMDGGFVFGHDGGTIGQNSFLRIAPDHDLAVVLFVNGGTAFALYTEIVGHVLRELAGIVLPPVPTPGQVSTPTDVSRYLGKYSSSVADTEVSQDEDGRVWLHRQPKGIFAQLGGQPERVELVGWDTDTLIPVIRMNGVHMPHSFVGEDGDGHALFLHTGRADRRVTA